MLAGILYVGTDDGLEVYHVSAAGEAALAARSLAGHAVRAIVAADADTLLAAADGLPPQQSFDGGATWGDSAGEAPEPLGLRVATTGAPVKLLNPRLAGATAYALLAGKPPALLGAGAGGMMIFRSDDEGIHWRPGALAVGSGGPAGRVTSLAPDAASPSRAWAGTDSGALLLTRDRGDSWVAAGRAGAPVRCIVSCRPA